MKTNRPISFKNVTLFLIFFSISFIFFAQNSTVQIDHLVQRSINGISSLDRSKFFNIHDNSGDSDMQTFTSNYNVGKGRGFWGPFSYARSQTGSVGNYPAGQAGDNTLRNVTRYVATEHPYNVFFNGINASAGADWAVEYYKDFVNDSGRPEFFELMNEPFVHAPDYDDATTSNAQIKAQMANFYKEVGLRFSQTPALANMKIIGYSSAWPSMELWGFDHWNQNMKMFMDTAGDYMHGFSVHLYDGINITGQDNKRSGSNSEAILDLIETYSYTKWGYVKPHAITEYGAIESGYGDAYSDIANAQTMRSLNHVIFNLIDREDRVSISIPFVTGKSTWHINAGNNYQPYGAVLWKPSNIGQPNPTGWVYTPRILFYDLWKDVKGNRALIKSDNPDVQTQAFINDDTLYVALSNLDDQNQVVTLDLLSDLSNLVDVEIKSLKIYSQQLPVLNTSTVVSAPANITLIPDETAVLAYRFSTAIVPTSTMDQTNYYTTTHLVPITANTDNTFTFNNIVAVDGFATLRMSIGRKHDRSKSPIVKVNGTTVPVPDNWRGYNQANRSDFFGMIDIPVPINLIEATTTVTINFPDSNGHISSLILSVDNTTGTLDISDLDMSGNDLFVYPNPVKDTLILHFGDVSSQNETDIAIYTNTGALISTETRSISNTNAEIDVNNLASGLYYITVSSKEATNKTLKFIKE